MINEGKISVIVPVYNAEKYLNQCVDSILNQTYRNFEIFLIDDGSTDNSLNICKNYSGKFKNITTIHTDNFGPSHARNIGISKSVGDYLLFVDADDYIENNMIELLIKNIGDADVIMCNYKQIQSNKESKVLDHQLGNNIYDKEDIQKIIIPAFYYGGVYGLGSMCNKLYKKDFIIENNIKVNEKLIRAEDFWFNFDVLAKIQTFVTIDVPLYCYMQINPNSTMHQLRETQYEDWVFTRKKLLDKYNILNLKFDLDMNLFYKNFISSVYYYILQRLYNDIKDKKVLDILKDDFYKNAIKYRKYVSLKIKFVLIATYLNSNLAYFIYKLISRFKIVVNNLLFR